MQLCHRLYKILLGDNVHWQDREAWVYSKGVHTRYPFQGALYGLPTDVIKECIVGAMEARYGASKTPHTKSMEGTCHGTDGAAAVVSDCCADGTGSIAPESGKVRSAEGVVEKERTKLRRFHLPGVGGRYRETFCDTLQQKTLDSSTDGNGNFLAWGPRTPA